MNDVAVNIATRRAVIETNLERCRDMAWINLVEIGRWLNRAKAEGVVPHGEWTSWVLAHAGMNERMAQRAMQFARELPEGSPIAQLGTAKISALLTLPAGEREEVAARIDAEHATSREVAAQVKAIREERDEALRLIGVQKKQLAQARKGGSVSLAAQEEIDGLKKKLAAREREIDQLTEQLDETQMDLARAGIAGNGMRVDPTTLILSAIGALMAEAGSAPGELDRVVSPIDEETRRLVLTQAYQVKQWAGAIIVKLGGELRG